MKSLVGSLLLIVASLGVVGPRIKDGTNSKVEADRGAHAYSKGDHKKAVTAYGSVKKLAPGVISSFDLGTALVAAGDRAKGTRELEAAVKDPRLGAMAHYNRGNAELDAKKYDGAIREYVDALRLNPHDLRFKRNLEIALRKKQQQKKKQQQNNGGGKNKQQQQSDQKKPDQNKSGQKQQPKSAQRKDQKSNEMESILRSVEQQEREELQRMLKARVAKRPIGW